MKQFSRRSVLCSVVFSLPVLRRTEASGGDILLVGLGCQFDAISAKLDRAIEQAHHIDWSDLEEFGRIVDKIVATPATTIDGLCVKARVGCWALLGDLDDPDEETTAVEKMAVSIMRDLIRLRHPKLERPGALKKLVQDRL